MNEMQASQPPASGLVEPRQVEFYGTRLWLRASAAATGGVYSLFEGSWDPGGFGPLPHIHRNEDEAFYVLDGIFDVHVGDRIYRSEAGSFILAPRGHSHWFENVGDRPGRLAFIHTPSIEGYFFELEELARSTPADPQKIRALMNKWGMDTPTS
jgi:mannose-6-phosphate isomerase-like protein (cupin superfamily)